MAPGSVTARPIICCCWRATAFSAKVRQAFGGPLIPAFCGFSSVCCQNATTAVGRIRKKYPRELYFQFSEWFNRRKASKPVW